MASIAPTQTPLQEHPHESATQHNLHYGFFQTPDAILTTKGLSWRARCVYERLLWYARKKETCYPGHARLAADLGKSVDTIQRGLRELRDYGLITWRRRGLTKTNVYTIVRLTDVPALKNDVSPKPQKCGDQMPHFCGSLKPQKCGTNHIKSKNIQLEIDEDSSNSSEGMVEVTAPTCSHGEHGTIRKPEEKTVDSPPPPVSNQHTGTIPHTPPSLPNRGEPSKLETPRVGGAGRQPQSLERTDEIKRAGNVGGKPTTRAARELPRLPAAPFTQEDMDSRIRQRLARERGRAEMQNPLPGIIRDEDWHKLEQDTPTQTPTGRCKPMPVYSKLQETIERISDELDDLRVVTSNITHVDNIRREANVSLEQLLDAVAQARYATRVALQKGSITKRDETGRLVKMPYFFECLRQKLGLKKEGRSVV